MTPCSLAGDPGDNQASSPANDADRQRSATAEQTWLPPYESWNDYTRLDSPHVVAAQKGQAIEGRYCSIVAIVSMAGRTPAPAESLPTTW